MTGTFAESDEALMLRYRNGQVEALGELFDRYASRVEALVLRLTGQPALSRDITQTTFLSVVRGRARFRDDSAFRPWLFAIAMNALRDHTRRRKREVLLPGDASVFDSEHHDDSPRDGALSRRLHEAVDLLPVEQREAIVLHQVEDFSFAEIAEIVGCSRSAAKVRAHRGYQRLRELLGDAYGADHD